MKRLLSLLLTLTLMVMLLPAQPAKADLADVLDIRAGRRVEFEDGARGEWKKLSGDRIQVRFKVTNNTSKTVKGFELYVYATDIWGERIYGESTYYYWTTTKKIAPGKSAFSDWTTLPDRSRVDRLYCVIKRVAFTDGTIREIEDSKLEYGYWTVEW